MFVCLGLVLDSCKNWCMGMYPEKGTSVSANREVISGKDLIWVEDTFGAFSRDFDHGLVL